VSERPPVAVSAAGSAPGTLPPVPAFGVTRLPRVVFGAGRIADLPAVVAGYGKRVLLVTGARSFHDGSSWPALIEGLAACDITVDHLAVAGEPSPEVVDGAVAASRADPPDVVVGIGGGSAMDAAKAIAGLLRSGTVCLDHLEGVGRGIPYPGPATPFIAVPTTAGTGSEATRNAVLSGRLPGAGPETPPFKKSFRDERLVAEVALLDPDLLAGCPPGVIAGDGMDALTQCLEALVSTGASPFTDGIARSGLAAIGPALPAWHAAALRGPAGERTPTNPTEATAAARAGMAWGALASGIALANAGLGAVHGIVAALGAAFPVLHGTGCGILLAATTRANIRALEAREPRSPALPRYAVAGRILAGATTADDAAARAALEEWLAALAASLALPGLGSFGIGESHLASLVAESRGSSMRTNPVVLTDDEIAGILRACR
jgi:alcohol dehydrogenase class IV